MTRWTYDIEPGRTVSMLQGNHIFTSHPITPVSLLYSCALVEIELMIGLFTLFEVMEPQMNYMKELYGIGEYKLTWMLVDAFPALHVFYIYQTCIFCNFHEIHFGINGNSLL